MKPESRRDPRGSPTRAAPCHVALIRGINVGGARPLKMARLREILEKLGYSGVRTHLQSGNAVFSAGEGSPASIARAIERAIKAGCGLEVSAAVLTGADLAAAVARNPLVGMASVDPAFLHATFLVGPRRRPPTGPDEFPLGRGERVAVVGDVVYLYCPKGYSATKLQNGYLERTFQARATTRNWRTLSVLEAMARGVEP